jgi:hypothetical protein
VQTAGSELQAHPRATARRCAVHLRVLRLWQVGYVASSSVYEGVPPVGGEESRQVSRQTLVVATTAPPGDCRL